MAVNDWSDMRKFEETGTDNLKGEMENQNEMGTGFDDIVDWNDLRKFDDDHDNDWFKNQEKLMAEKYGGNFIKVKYSNNGNVAYFCELCLAECNAKKSLELHCSGMKHLKKKDVWEKEGKPPPNIFIMKASTSSVVDSGKDQKESKSRERDTGGSRRDRRRSRSRSRSRGRRPSPPYWDRNRRGFGYERDIPGRGGRDVFSRMGPRDSSYPNNDPYPSSRYYPEPSTVMPRDFGYDRDRRYGEPMERRTPPLRPRYGGRYSPVRDAPAPPSPPRFKSPSPAPVPVPKTNLATSPAGNLLQKLSECCVKSSDDADLALSVVASLTKSLKEYSQRKGETKIAELLMEAELKVGTVKALKVGMKMLSNFADPSFKTEPDTREVYNNFQKDSDTYNSSFERSNPYSNSRLQAPMGYPSRY